MLQDIYIEFFPVSSPSHKHTFGWTPPELEENVFSTSNCHV